MFVRLFGCLHVCLFCCLFVWFESVGRLMGLSCCCLVVRPVGRLVPASFVCYCFCLGSFVGVSVVCLLMFSFVVVVCCLFVVVLFRPCVYRRLRVCLFGFVCLRFSYLFGRLHFVCLIVCVRVFVCRVVVIRCFFQFARLFCLVVAILLVRCYACLVVSLCVFVVCLRLFV